MKNKVIKEISIITGIVILTSFVGLQAKMHERGNFVSPIPDRAYAMDTDKPKVIVMASLSEQERNIEIIKKIWGKDWKLGVAIAKCEGGLRSDAINHNTDGSEDVGLFQINSIHGWTEDDMKNPIANASIAYNMFRDQGLSPWESSRHCWR